MKIIIPHMASTVGYNTTGFNVTEAISRLESHLKEFPPRLQQLGASQLLDRPSPDKWSKKEILGHLVDSAINNLKRFTDIQVGVRPYQLVSYKQQELVAINNYQELPPEHILTLWHSLNRQIVYVVENTSSANLSLELELPNEAREIKTLQWLIGDYVAHMEHHFRQIFGSEKL